MIFTFHVGRPLSRLDLHAAHSAHDHGPLHLLHTGGSLQLLDARVRAELFPRRSDAQPLNVQVLHPKVLLRVPGEVRLDVLQKSWRTLLRIVPLRFERVKRTSDARALRAGKQSSRLCVPRLAPLQSVPFAELVQVGTFVRRNAELVLIHIPQREPQAARTGWRRAQ